MTNRPQVPTTDGTPEWALRSRDLLERSAQELDGATLSRLNRARQAALDSLDRAQRESHGLRWFGAAALSAGLALVLWRALLPTTPDGLSIAPIASVPTPVEVATPAVASTAVAAPDFELLADAESYALLEDLEFYAWLEAEEGNGG